MHDIILQSVFLCIKRPLKGTRLCSDESFKNIKVYIFQEPMGKNHQTPFTAYADTMKVLLEYMGKAVLLMLILMAAPCMVLWFHTGNSQGLDAPGINTEDSSMEGIQIMVDSRLLNVETFLIYMISVDYSADMEEETLKALAVAARSKLYAHLKAYKDTADEQTAVKTDEQTAEQTVVKTDEQTTEQIAAKTDDQTAVGADELNINWQSPGEMVSSLQQAEADGHWSDGYKRIKSAVKKTSGEYLVWSGQPADVMWHAISAGNTRFYSGNETWTSDGISLFCPELKSMDGNDGALPEAVTITTYTRRQLAELIWEISGTEDILTEEEKALSSWFQINERDSTGYITEMYIGDRKMTGEEAAQLLQLSSGCFYLSDVDMDLDSNLTSNLALKSGSESGLNADSESDSADCLKILTFGSGTGYGMSLAGAKVMAEQGTDYQKILAYYFPVCEIKE